MQYLLCSLNPFPPLHSCGVAADASLHSLRAPETRWLWQANCRCRDRCMGQWYSEWRRQIFFNHKLQGTAKPVGTPLWQKLAAQVAIDFCTSEFTSLYSCWKLTNFQPFCFSISLVNSCLLEILAENEVTDLKFLWPFCWNLRPKYSLPRHHVLFHPLNFAIIIFPPGSKHCHQQACHRLGGLHQAWLCQLWTGGRGNWWGGNYRCCHGNCSCLSCLIWLSSTETVKLFYPWE